MRKIVTTLILLSFIALLPFIGSAQCKGFTKRRCLPKVEPYIFNEQLNVAVLNQGDIAELVLTFHSGQDYRVLVCSQDILGGVEFKLLDSEYNVIFDNKDHNLVEFWDFHANSTQQLIVQVQVQEGENLNSIVESGCVSILIGFKEPDIKEDEEE